MRPHDGLRRRAPASIGAGGKTSARPKARETFLQLAPARRLVRPAALLCRQLWQCFPEVPRLFLGFEKTHQEDHDLELTPDDIPDIPGLCVLEQSSLTAHAEAKHRKGAKGLA